MVHGREDDVSSSLISSSEKGLQLDRFFKNEKLVNLASQNRQRLSRIYHFHQVNGLIAYAIYYLQPYCETAYTKHATPQLKIHKKSFIKNLPSPKSTKCISFFLNHSDTTLYGPPGAISEETRSAGRHTSASCFIAPPNSHHPIHFRSPSTPLPVLPPPVLTQPKPP